MLLRLSRWQEERVESLFMKLVMSIALVIKIILKALDEKLEDIKKVYLPTPESVLLGLPFGSLMERLKAWENYSINNSLFQKAPVLNLLYLLNVLDTSKKISPWTLQ